MVALRTEYAHPDLEGLCRSPHDHPPKWALMLTMYLDESIEAENGHAVVAGFLGTDEAWNTCMRMWRAVKRPPAGLHMKKLRLRESHRLILGVLGGIPTIADLMLVYGSVKVSDYRDLVEGNVGEIVNSGYITAMTALICRLMYSIDPTERIEVICEAQVEYAAMRELVFGLSQRMPDWKTPEGLPRIAKWSSMAKSTILEPSDYAAYSLMHRLRDPSSRKSLLCAPILANPSHSGWCMDRYYTRELVTRYVAQKGPLPLLNETEMKVFRSELKNLVRSKSDGT